jgi:cytochrome b
MKMKENKRISRNDLGPFSIFIHLGLLVFGLSAALTGLSADDYKKMEHLGFTVHSWLSLGLAGFLGLRIITGIIGPRNVRFSHWIPVTSARIKLVMEDIAGLLRFHMPERPVHQGLAGVVETFGLLALLMAATGGYLYLFLEPGHKAIGLVHDIKELHEAASVLIPMFLSLHAGAVIMHALTGNRLWKKIFFISDRVEKQKGHSEAILKEQ